VEEEEEEEEEIQTVVFLSNWTAFMQLAVFCNIIQFSLLLVFIDVYQQDALIQS
jgi:hypothetical protein